jgi:predicted porin
MRKYLLITFFLLSVSADFAYSQVSIGVGVGPRMGYGGYGQVYGRPYQRRRLQKSQNLPKFNPIVRFSLGYGYPNLDKSQMASFYGYSLSNVKQTGPITGSLDYQYSQNSSIGLMVTHGQVSGSYYDYNNPTGPAVMSGSLDNWSVMVNMMNYMPGSEKVVPYFRTAVGINIWTPKYTDAIGNKMNGLSDPNQLAYQVSLGANIHLSKNTGLFMEAGYGKYIVQGGLTFRL